MYHNDYEHSKAALFVISVVQVVVAIAVIAFAVFVFIRYVI